MAKNEGQITLWSGKETPDSFRKAVQVLHSKPQSPLTLLQRKLGNAWIKNAIENSPDHEGWWELSIVELAEDIGFDSNNRQYLKDSAEALMRIIFEWDVLATTGKRVPWKASVMFPEVEIHSHKIRYQISSQVRDRMINPEIYAMIDMNVVRRFRRASSLGIWEFCVRFEKLGKTAEVEWEKFRDMILGGAADNKTYQAYKYFKSKAILPAIVEINGESDHTIVLHEGKQGKRVKVIWFEVQRKGGDSAEPEDGVMVELIADMYKLGVPKSEATQLSRSEDTQDLRTAIEYTKKRLADKKLPKLENAGAYFRQALKGGYGRVDEDAASGGEKTQKGQGKAVDLRESYVLHQSKRAEEYFASLEAQDQTDLMERYNAAQSSPVLKLKSKASRVAQVAFWKWLAEHTWGQPQAEDLIAFAQEMLSKQE